MLGDLDVGISQHLGNASDGHSVGKRDRSGKGLEKSGLKTFGTVSRTIQNHYPTILNYFDKRHTNASAESFNAKIKSLRAQFRGVRNVEFWIMYKTCGVEEK